MTLYRYEAVSEKGRKVRGTIDAESLQDAKQKLIRRQVLVTGVVSIKEKNRRGALKKNEILSLTRELARLIQAGLPLHDSLSALEEKYRTHKAHEILLDLCDQIRAGRPFSESLGRHPACFDLLYRAMVANAEQSGNLPKALEEIARLTDRRLQLRKQILSAFLYPALLGSFCLVVLCVLLFFVVPTLFDLFEGRTLHPFTRFVFACSHFARDAKWGLLSIMAVLIGFVAWSFSERGCNRTQKVVLRLPFLGPLLAKIALVRFFRASATLLEGGLPALLGLSQAKSTLDHPGLEQSINEALQRLAEGEPLEHALEGRPFIPPLVARMLGIAQTGGNLPSMMHQIALIYEEELERSFSKITTFAQPILLLVLGAIVGFVLLSVLLPLTDISNFST